MYRYIYLYIYTCVYVYEDREYQREVEEEAVWTRRRLAQLGTLSRSELEAFPIPLTTLPLSSNRPMLSLSSKGALDSELEISNP